jgi:AcrR family transcriptional regulator
MRSTAKARSEVARLVPKVRRGKGRSSGPPRSGRTRQERGIRTEAAILDATLRSLARRGIHETSLELIAAEVGVAKSSILWHFGSKEGLLLRVAERAFSTIEHGPAREILALPTFQQRGEAMWRFYSEAIRREPEVRRVVLYLIFASAEGRPELRTRLQQLYQGMRTLFAAGFEDVIAVGAPRHHLATLAIAALDGIFLQWLLDPKAVDLAELQGQLRRLTQHAGMGAVPGVSATGRSPLRRRSRQAVGRSGRLRPRRHAEPKHSGT